MVIHHFWRDSVLILVLILGTATLSFDFLCGIQMFMCTYIMLKTLQLCVPGCLYLTADGVVKVVKRLFEHEGNLKHLQLRGICNITKKHLDVLNYFMCKNNPCQISRPSFYSHWCIVSFNRNADRPVDVDMCPKCKNVNLVFDCTRENCRLVHADLCHLYGSVS